MEGIIELVLIGWLLMTAPYTAGDYEVNEFDCSNMGALLEDRLEEAGYGVTVRLIVGDEGVGHVYLKIDDIAIEPVTKQIVDESIYEGSYGGYKILFGVCLEDMEDLEMLGLNESEWKYKGVIMRRDLYRNRWEKIWEKQHVRNVITKQR